MKSDPASLRIGQHVWRKVDAWRLKQAKPTPNRPEALRRLMYAAIADGALVKLDASHRQVRSAKPDRDAEAVTVMVPFELSATLHAECKKNRAAPGQPRVMLRRNDVIRYLIAWGL